MPLLMHGFCFVVLFACTDGCFHRRVHFHSFTFRVTTLYENLVLFLMFHKISLKKKWAKEKWNGKRTMKEEET